MKRKGIFLLVVAGVILLTGLGFLLLRKPAGPEKVEKLRLGIFPDPICTLIYIAQQRGMFKRHGLDLAVADYQAGAYAVNDLLTEKIDVATATGFVLALQGFKRPDLRAISAISSTDNVKVIARRNRGINNPEDLRGKVVGVSKGTINEFFLSIFLSLNNILPGEVRTIDLRPADAVSAMAEGKVDAVSSFPPFSDTIEKNLGSNGATWPAQGGQDYYFLLITRDELIKARPRAIESLLKGALEAEDFMKKNENEAQRIVERALGLGHESVIRIWSKTRFHVSLDQSLLTLMEDEARWALQNRLVEAKKVPNYLNYLYLDELMKLRPRAVGVVH